MGRDIAFAIEKLENNTWQIHNEWINGFSKKEGFYCFQPLELLHYIPSHKIYGMPRIGEFTAILCGIGNDDEFWCNPISENFGLPSDVSVQVEEEFNKTSDSGYGEPVCITLQQLMNYDFTGGWTNEHKQMEPFSENVMNSFSLLTTELTHIGSPDRVRLIFWFF